MRRVPQPTAVGVVCPATHAGWPPTSVALRTGPRLAAAGPGPAGRGRSRSRRAVAGFGGIKPTCLRQRDTVLALEGRDRS